MNDETMARWVEPHRVHRRAFVDPTVFEQEMARVFSRTWVYVGHESEIATPGSYKATTLGTQPVLLTRLEKIFRDEMRAHFAEQGARAAVP